MVIKLMVDSDLSRVLFTADPITGSHTSMIGNYVYGLGEGLVSSGETDAYEFKLKRPKGKYEGPKDLKNYNFTSSLYKYASNLEKELNCPMAFGCIWRANPPANGGSTVLIHEKSNF